MMTVGWKSIPIARLNLPGDWRKTLDDPSIPSRAKSIKAVGMIHEPLVRESDMKLIVGRRRVAAALHNGEEEVLCKLVECTNDEAELVSLMENAYREHMSSEEQKRLVGLLAERLTVLHVEREKDSILEPKRKRGRMKLPRTIARELIQEATGRTKEAQRKAEQRVHQQHKELAEKVDHDADIGIRSPWAELTDEFRKATNDVVKQTHETCQLLSRALGRLTLLADSGLPLQTGRLNRIREELAIVAKSLRGMVPVSTCPFCKNVEEIQEAPCGGCFGAGYITTNQEAGVPQELWEVADKAIVMQRGKAVPYEKFFDEPTGTEGVVADCVVGPPVAPPTFDNVDVPEEPYMVEEDADPNFEFE